MSIPGVTMATWPMLLAIVTSLGLGGAVLARAPRRLPQWSFAVGMLAFAAEATALYALAGTDGPEDRMFFLTVWMATASLAPIPWGLFLVSLAAPEATPRDRRLHRVVAASGLICLAAAAVVVFFPAYVSSDMAGPFYAAQLDIAGRWAVVVQLLASVAILAGFDLCLRGSRHETRWRLKYLLLGLGATFIARFFFLGQIILFQVVLATYLTTASAILVLGNLVAAVSLARRGMVESRVTMSRAFAYRSVVVVILGGYLLVTGVLAWLPSYLGVPNELFWGSLLVFVSGLGVAAVSLSESVRWRLRRFIGLHFYRSKYDYRDQWMRFTKRLGSRLSPEEFGAELLAGLTEAAGAVRAALYLGDSRSGGYYLAATVNLEDAPKSLAAGSRIAAGLQSDQGPHYMEELTPSADLVARLGDGAVVVPLRSQGTPLGAILIGPERAGVPYTAEDLEFFMTVGEQAVGVVVTARLSESLAQAREFEAFHQLTSSIIHDVKNAVSALSLLSQNALKHFDDPEFQRDALTTLARTVDRMSALLARLSSAPDTGPLRFQPVDLSTLALEALRPVPGGAIAVVKEMGPVPPVPGDPEALLRVVQNLIANAVEAIPEEGTVTVRTFEEAGSVVCSVSDTGGGISQEFIQRSLFAPFRSTKRRGWGIGLYHARSIVEAHGGSIEVHSVEGHGTTFRVRLPIYRGAEAVGAR